MWLYLNYNFYYYNKTTLTKSEKKETNDVALGVWTV